MEKKLTIFHISPEVAPFAKTGGLADVVGSLPLALKKLGHEVCVVMPFHRQVRQGKRKVTKLSSRLSVPIGGRFEEAGIYKGDLAYPKKIPIYFLENDKYFDREGLYGTPQGDYPDNAERFSSFCRGALELMVALKVKADVIHCHDWQSALVPLYLKLFYRDTPHLSKVGTIFTVHNMAYQGIFEASQFAATGLPLDIFTPKGIEYYGKVNFLKAGLIYSDLITTVSQKYSQEIQTPEYGYGLEGVLKERAADLVGILNGVDYKEWDPTTDKYIVAQYDVSKLSGKDRCKEDLLKEFGLEGLIKKPVIGMIGRLAEQKGLDLLEAVAEQLLALDMGLVLLGTGDAKYEKLISQMAKRHPAKMGARITFDNRLAHKIEAGCDLFLMPSKYEPCGLNQIYSLKYGTIPIVRATGGLDDTITPFDPTTGKGNGFKFQNYHPGDMVKTIEEAVKLFNQSKAAWQKLMRNAMTCDFSWERSAQEYIELYHRVASKAAER